MDVTASSPEDVSANVENKDNRNDDREEQKKFVPPPEYDANDSRWTLKYSEPAPGLVELIKHSGVYINADKLAECKKWSNDCKIFAERLLTEIFTISALSTCSWSGLDKHATDILLQFVVEYGQIRDWMGTDYQCILKGIRQVMLQMKRAQQNKDKEVEREPLIEKGTHKRKFIFPPEYDKYDSRWTLKYREYAPGLVELKKDSCVYVNAEKLAKCKKFSKDSVTLARMLLAEIFTTTTLSICSVTATSTTGKNIRPALNENAMATLLDFVAEYEMKNRWIETEKQCILGSIRQKLQVLRRVTRLEGEEEKKEEYEEDSSYSPSEKDEENEQSKKNCSQKCKFRYHPPEYDKNDSRWTLKYRGPAPGLVELMEHSGVYVNAEKLTECKRLSNDCKTFAEKLFNEIFTKNALATCSLSKKNLKCYKTYTADPNRCQFLFKHKKDKPELDGHAEVIVLNFVDEYGIEKGWPVFDFWFVRKFLESKMLEKEEIYVFIEDERRRAARDKEFPMC